MFLIALDAGARRELRDADLLFSHGFGQDRRRQPVRGVVFPAASSPRAADKYCPARGEQPARRDVSRAAACFLLQGVDRPFGHAVGTGMRPGLGGRDHGTE